MDEKLIHGETTNRILKACYNLHYAVGPGFAERVYQRGMEVEFEALGIDFGRQVPFEIVHRKKVIGRDRVDFCVEDKVIVEIKASREMDPVAEAQLFSYLRSSKFQVGLVINFGSKKLQFVRRVLTQGEPKVA